ncbi:S49 family peptidase [Ahrensia sp. R2A130]|uniref:S49 family peptidase n=1 Tax=Ahrensia sp. R2A130 TaxID=744979 RepID=UPI0018DB9A86
MGMDAAIIPVVRLEGAIMSGGSALRQNLNLAGCASRLKRAFEMKEAPCVAIIVNSPGGSPVQSRLIYQRIRDLATEHDKKVHVFVEDAAASGGYMIACAGDQITADPSSIIGSIGVVSSGFGFVGAINKLGVERRVHTAGLNKSVLDPFLPEKAQDIKRLKELQLEIHGVFIDLVKASRSDKLVEDKSMFTGMFWTAGPAKDMGLIDGIGDLRGTLRGFYGEKTKLKLVEAKKGLLGRSASMGISGLGIPVMDANLGHQIADGLLSTAEERALWGRIGL